MNELEKPDYLIEVSWEVCNLVGGIYTVLSTKARTLKELFGDHLVFIGPDIWKDTPNPTFVESADVLPEWRVKALLEGLKVRTGYWNIPGKPMVVLVDFELYYAHKDQVYTNMWNWYGVDSLHAYGDYDEASMFAYSAALVAQSLYHFWEGKNKKVVAQFNEWTTGMGLLFLKKFEPDIATVFTTHATSIGRSIAGNNKPLYDYLEGYFGDQMAKELNMESKHSIEKQAAHQADAFTTVSDITARESNQLLERMPLVTPNGFEEDFVPVKERYSLLQERARAALLNLTEKLVGYTATQDAFLVATAGRYEFKNKGLDVFINALDQLRHEQLHKEVIVFILVPAWVAEPRHDLQHQLSTLSYIQHPLSDPIITHTLHNPQNDQILNRLHELRFRNDASDKVKVVYVPSYLKGDDGILNMTYYDLLIGMDATVFPSYYEPWGYTPLESIAFGVPTVTTDLSGFGKWCESEGVGNSILSGVKVIHRTDSNSDQVVKGIATTLHELTYMPPGEMLKIRAHARELASHAEWKNFISYYETAYDQAIRTARKREEEKNV
ncbi:MAG: glycogen/starch synthase [Bacteroidales bacterium]